MSYTVDTLEMQVIASAESGISSMQKLVGIIDKTDESVTSLSINVKGLEGAFKKLKGLTSVTGDVNKGIKDIESNSRNTAKSVDDMNKQLEKTSRIKMPKMEQGDTTSGLGGSVFSIAKIALAVKAVKGLTKATVGGAIEMTENYNLFNASMGKMEEQAMTFQSTLTSQLGVNFAQSMKYQGFFKSLAENMNIASDSAYLMSENLTKLVYDLSSLYNIDVNSAYSKLQSGMIGQTKPLRELGIDVTAQTLQGYIDGFGWDTRIQEMTQAEKVMLRYIAVLDQSRLAHGNMAMSINAPASQMRIFSQTIQEAAAWIGTAFLGALSTVMHYLNGFAMAVKEIAKSIATLLGFKLGDFGFGGGAMALPEIEDMGAGVEDVGNKADKAKKKMLGLLGFEEIHNIQTPQETSGGGGGGGGGSLGSGSYYDDLVAKLGSYDNLMDSVNSKAKQVRNNLLDWLGFQYRINKATGELVGLKWGGFKEMHWSAKLLAGVLATIVGIKLWGWATKAFGAINTGLTVANKLTKSVFGTGIIDNAKLLFSAIGDGIKKSGFVKGAVEGSKAWWDVQTTFSKVAIGAGVMATGMALASSGAKDLAREGEVSAKSVVKMTTGIAGATAGGAMLGSVIPGVGTAIGAFAGFVLGSVTAMISYNKEMQRMRYEAELFDGVGVPIDDYTLAVLDSIDAVNASGNEIVKWIDKHKESRKAIADATQGVDFLNTKMSNSVYKTTTKDVEAMAKAMDSMSTAVEQSGEEFVNATILMTDKLVEEGKISKETADKVVANAIRKADAENDFMASYSIKVKDLATQLENGSISIEDYRVEMSKLQNQYNDMIGTTEDLTSKFTNLSGEAVMQIDLGNWKKLERAIDDISGAYNEQSDVQKENHRLMMSFNQEQIDEVNRQLETLEKNGGKESQLYKDTQGELEALKETRKGLTNSFQDESVKLDGIVATSFGNILFQLHNTGTEMTKDGKETSETLIGELSSMGYKVNFKDGLVSSIQDANGTVVADFSAMGTSSGKAMYNKTTQELNQLKRWATQNPVYVGTGVDTSAAYNGIDSLVNNINSRNPLISVGMKSDGSTLNFGSGSLGSLGSIYMYANGGLPSLGEMFIAREKGPEMVGRIGNSSAVANNNQIVESVSSGVARAVQSVLGGGNSKPINLFLPNGKMFASWIVDEVDNLAMTSGKTFRTV